jgi:hypothetical protein
MLKFKKTITLYLILCILFIFSPVSRPAEAVAKPRLGFRLSVPSQAETRPGKTAIVLAQAENFKMGHNLYNWCVFGKTFQSVQAGSDDQFLDKDGNLGNKYGKLEGTLSCGAVAMAKTGDYGGSDIRMPAIVTNPKSDGTFEKGSSFGGPVAVGRNVYWKDEDPTDGVNDNDLDKDGMADLWEIGHFKKFAGTTQERGCGDKVCTYIFPAYDPNKPLPFLQYITREMDFDNDGWGWWSAFPECSGKTPATLAGDACRFSHAESLDFGYGDCCGGGGCARESDFCNPPNDVINATGIPSASGSQTGDGKFTNWEEYVFGLDPTSADTDQDGILDEADLAGFEGSQCQLKINEKIGQIGRKIPVASILYGLKMPDVEMPSSVIYIGAGVGAATGAALGVWFFGVGAVVGAAIGALVGAGLSWLVSWIGGDKVGNFMLLVALDSLTVIPGPPLKVFLEADPGVPISENTGDKYPKVKVRAQVGAEKKENLYFRWSIGGKLVNEASGYGKDVFEFSMTDPGVFNNSCNYNLINCDVLEEGTGSMGSADLKLEVGKNIAAGDLSASLLLNQAQDGNNDGYIDGDTNKNFTQDGDEIWNVIDPFRDQINSDLKNNKVNVRQGDIIKIDTTNNIGFCSQLDSNEAKDFVYQWYLDGKEQVDQSGQGDMHQDFQFTVSKPLISEHLVKLKLIRISDGFEYGQLGEKAFKVVGPEIGAREGKDWVEFDGTGNVFQEATQSDGTNVYTITLKSGQTESVTLDSFLKNFRPTHSGVESFHYYWTANGEDKIEGISLMDFTKEGTTSYFCKDETVEDIAIEKRYDTYCETLKPEKSITIPFNYVDDRAGTEVTYTLALKVDNLIDEDSIADESATRTAIVKIKYEAGGEARGPVTRLFAQAGQAVSNYFKNIFNVVLSIGVIGFIVFVAMAAGEVRKRKK